MVYYSKWKTKVALAGKLICSSCPFWCQRLIFVGHSSFLSDIEENDWRKIDENFFSCLFNSYRLLLNGICGLRRSQALHTLLLYIIVITLNPKTAM